MEEAKKISFSFSKVNKKLNILPIKENTKNVAKVELIKCLEGKEIKLVEEKSKEQPLVIPLKESQKTSAALASLLKRRAVLLGEEELNQNGTNADKQGQLNSSNNIDVPEDIEKRAARELLAEIESNSLPDTANTLILPVVKPDDLPLEGARESTLDDYEHIPVQEFGKAILRGMGWKEPPKTNKNGGLLPIDEIPLVRPKGMGLGADKALNKKPLLVAPDSNEVLEIKRNAYVCILGGKHKDLYGRIEGFDDHAGRVIVKMAIGGNKEAFNEFLCQPVSKKEYVQYGKCINSSKYEEYKKKENEYGQVILNKDEKARIDKSIKEENIKKDTYASPANEYKYQNSNDNRDERKYIKKDDRDREHYDKKNHREIGQERGKHHYDEKYRSRNDDEDRRKKSKQDREYTKKFKREEEDGPEESKRYESQTEHTQSYRKDDNDNHSNKSLKSYCYKDSERNSNRDNRNCDRTANRNGQWERDRKYYTTHSERRENKVIDSPSDSVYESHTSTQKKSKKTKSSKKKSKKSKKSKSKYKSESSDTESDTDTDTTSNDSVEEKHRKHKKKTKKSKKQRERSRSRERR